MAPTDTLTPEPTPATAEDGVGVASDRAALVALYNATEGGSWITRTNWLSGRPLDEWHGVTTDSDGRVTALNLSSNSLYGALPAALGDLSNLRALNLGSEGRGRLTGPIPAALGRLSNLQRLVLFGNQLTGEIPKELGSLANLTLLYLGNNELTGEIPPELGGLSNLQRLVLFGNQLTGEIPPELGGLSNLQQLYLFGNQLTGEIPPELGGLSNLTGLSLADNGLTGEIPPELGGLSNLTELFLSDNQLTGEIPPELGGLSNLTVLILADNGLTGEIPKELGSLANLTHLYLHDNQLTGEIPPELGGLSNLTVLYLSGNQLTGEIPPELGGLSNLTELWLHRNQLTGEIPPELGGLSNLTHLYLDNSLLTGCVPDGLRDVPNNDFVRLGLPFCSEHPCVSGGAVVDATNEGLVSDCGMLLAARDTLAGTASLNWSADTPIADWTGVALGEASGRVTELALGGMGLNGRIPPELGGLSNLTWLSLYRNQLTGEIPPELGGLSNLTELVLESNQLTGEIPPELGGLSNLKWLVLGDNQLTGEIPPELGGLSNLTLLFLADNGLAGCVPDGLRDVPNNDFVRLGLPFCSEHPCVSGGAVVDATNEGLVSDCGMLLAARDTLAGTASLNWSADTPITEWNGVALGEASGRVTELYLGALGLNGRIPKELGSLANLTHLYLHDNQLTGEIPPELGGLSNLTGLFLHVNGLTGEIPPELGGLSNLTELVLESNQLTGEIPPELGGLSNLQVLYLGGNLLTGCVPDGLRDVPDNDFDQLGLPFCDEHPCVSGGAVVDATNEGLVSDCGMLLAARDTLAGTAALNWSADTPIADWTGVALGEASGRVTELALVGMGLNGRIPTELGSLANLTQLSLDNNQLTGEIPPELGGLSNLTYLWLHRNQLTGEIPPELGGLSNLTGLFLHVNELTGEIPPELGGLSNLTELVLESNQLTGEIPPELGRLANLTLLVLADNGLTGEIPPELGGLSNLTHLYLDNNLLTGCVPDGLRDVPNNDFVRLGLPFCSEHPCVSGGVVVDATNEGLVSDCGMLLAARDTLAGTAALNWSADTPIADWTGVALGEASGRVTEILLVGMGLNGRIPKELGSLANLTELWLHRNQLTGEIPPELGGLSNLTWLVLESNQLTGEIPPELGDLSNLMWLYLSHNELTGEIPPELGRLANLTGLSLWGNQLTGEIPPELGGLSNLQRLWLGGNQLAGEIPPELGGLSNLTELYLYDNQLTGEIPPELGGLSNLTLLYLGGNQLTGCVPVGLRDVAEENDLGELELPDCGLEGRPAADSFVSVSAGGYHTCEVMGGGSVACWGSDYYGQATPPAGSFVSVSAGWDHTCGVRSDGSVTCWGSDESGRSTPPAGSFTSVSAGIQHTCGIRSDGSVDCWGSNFDGLSTPPAGSFTSVSAGIQHNCGVRSDGSVACWGSDESGQTRAPAGSFVSVSAGNQYTCGVRSDGSVACWGSNFDGRATPPAGSLVSVSAGSQHTCGSRSDGSVVCWGSDEYGQATPPAGSFVSVSAGGHHTCGIRSDGSVACWGSDGNGQAAPPAGSFSPTPAPTPETEPTTPTATPTSAPTPAPAAATLSLDEYLTLCAPPDSELADDATYGDYSSLLAAEADRLEVLTPPAQLSEWHLLNIENFRTIQAFVDLLPKDDVINFILWFLIAGVSDSEEKLSEATVRLPEDVLQQMIEVGCIDPEDLPSVIADGSDDHGDDIDDATAAAVGADIEGVIDYEGDSDYFRFTAEEGLLYQIDVTLGTLPDSYLALYVAMVGPNTWSLETNDDYENSLASRIIWEAPESGDYYLRLNGGVRYDQVGSYTLTVSNIDDDHGDDIDDATAAAVGADIEGVIDYEGDSDYFRFTAEEGLLYQIDVALGSLDDSIVALYDSDGLFLDSNDDYSGSTASRLLWQASSSGELYVAVAAYGSGTYTLTVSFSTIVDDHGDDIDDATAAAVGADIEGVIDYEGDSDYFRFTAEEGLFYQIDVTLGTLDDSIVELYDSDGSFLDTNDDYGDTLASRLYWNAPSSGERYVLVGGAYTSSRGTYTLTVTLSTSSVLEGTDDHGGSAADATAVTVGESIEGAVNYLGDEDVFLFQVEAGAIYEIEVAPGTLADFDLVVYDEPDEWKGRSFSSVLSVKTHRNVWRSEYTGDSYLVVGFPGFELGSYTVRVARITLAGNTSYDTDRDGLIEVSSLMQLNAVRWDLDGDGLPDNSAGIAGFAAAFPGALDGMGCPDSGCSGYELISDLDFDTNGNGRADAGDAYWNDGEGWAPIGHDFGAAFETFFNGGGHTISNLYIDRRDTEYAGLFGNTGFSGSNVWVGLNNNIRDLALVNVDVRGGVNTGGLAGFNGLVIVGCSVTGTVSGSVKVGGLVGNNFSGRIIASYSTASVADGSNTGGLVGSNFGGTIIASYSIGSVSDYNGVSVFFDVGGLVGSNFADRGSTRDSYWDTQTSGQSESAGGEGKTTSELQSPTGYTGIYENWNVDLDEDGVGDDLWDFGDASQYPRLRHGS